MKMREFNLILWKRLSTSKYVLREDELIAKIMDVMADNEFQKLQIEMRK